MEQWHHAKQFGYVLVEVNELDVTLTWTERHTNDLGVAGVYQPQEVWSYTAVLKPIILSPNGGEKLVAASTYTITWKTLEGAQIGYVAIEYSANNGESWQGVDTCENTGSYPWNVPPEDSNECLLRISDLNDTTANDVSDYVFTIFQCQQELNGDVNGDCYVDFSDLAILGADWLKCGNPFDPFCDVQQ